MNEIDQSFKNGVPAGEIVGGREGNWNLRNERASLVVWITKLPLQTGQSAIEPAVWQAKLRFISVVVAGHGCRLANEDRRSEALKVGHKIAGCRIDASADNHIEAVPILLTECDERPKEFDISEGVAAIVVTEIENDIAHAARL